MKVSRAQYGRWLNDVEVHDVQTSHDTGLATVHLLHEVQVTFRGNAVMPQNDSGGTNGQAATPMDGVIRNIIGLADGSSLSSLKGKEYENLDSWLSTSQLPGFRNCSINANPIEDEKPRFVCLKSLQSMSDALALQNELVKGSGTCRSRFRSGQ